MSNDATTTDFLNDFARALKRYWFRSSVVFFLIVAVVVSLLLVLPRRYESQGRFFVRYGRGGMTLDPTTTTSETVHIMESREAEINSVADILSSRALIDEVVDEVGVERILESNFFLKGELQLPSLPSFSDVAEEDAVAPGEDYNTLRRREKAIRKLEDDLKVKPVKKAATITISCRAATPKLAQEIVQTLMDRYLDLHINAHRTEGSFHFFRNQFADQDRIVQGATDAVRDFKNRTGITSIEGERDAVQAQINQVDGDIITTLGELASARQRTSSIEDQYARLEERLVTEVVDGTANGAGDRMRDRLFALEIEEKELLTKFHNTHPDVQHVREQIAEAKEIMREQPETRKEQTTAVNPVRLTVESELLAARADSAALAAKLTALREKRTELNEQLQRLNGNEAELAQLQRQLSIAQAKYDTYAEKLEEARINQALDQERISNVKIVQPASLVLKPASPKRLLMLLAALIMATFAAAATAQLSAAANPTIHTPDDVGRHMETPLVGVLPQKAARKVLSS
ncbi:MAG: hypothetical protein KDA60_01945 [Planctomycetales bacterium]|nr:hypothetical protein [Planctomycetales bacterium]